MNTNIVVVSFFLVLLALCLFYSKTDTDVKYKREKRKIKYHRDLESRDNNKKIDIMDVSVARCVEYTAAKNNLIDEYLVDYLVSNHTSPVLISPTSLLMCASLLVAGSSGTSLDELSRMLKIKDSTVFISNVISCNEYMKHQGVVNAHNYVITREDLVLQRPYVNTIKNFASFETYTKGQEEKLAHNVNNKVAVDTKGMIKKILNTGDVSRNTVLVFLNTIYFKGSWVYKFDKHLTKPKPFYGRDGERSVKMMQMRDNEHYYYEDDQKQMLCLEYSNGNDDLEMSMIFVLPKEDTSVSRGVGRGNNIYTRLDHRHLFQVYDEKAKVDVMIPKFELESSLDLVPFFKSFGVNSIFKKADLANMINYDQSEISDDVSVSKIIQKVKIIVDEEGTEAAAATAMTVSYNCAPPNEPSVPRFVANRPFRYYIMMNRQLVLFSGIVD